MQGLRLAWSDDNRVSENFNKKVVDAEKIYIDETTLFARTKNKLTQMSRVVFAVPKHAHCSLKASHLLALVASRCRFVGSFRGLERTALLGGPKVSILHSAICVCLST